MTIRDLADAAMTIMRLRKHYTRKVSSETALDFPVYAYLDGAIGSVSRQITVTVAGHAKRIDFRTGGSNPVVIEFAVRPPQGGVQLYGSQNQSELAKLTRVSQSRARTRILLLLDLSRYPIGRDALKSTYDKLNAGRGRFQRKSVRIVYVHEDGWYDFLWRPID